MLNEWWRKNDSLRVVTGILMMDVHSG